MRILVTAFEPFNGEIVNPALELVRRLPDQILGHELVWRVLPTAFGGARSRRVGNDLERAKSRFGLVFGSGWGT